MANTIPNLWPASALKTDILTPAAILRSQATRLGQDTHGLLIAEVTVTNGENGQVVLGLEVIVPALNNYRHRLLSVQYTRNEPYPALVSAKGFRITVTENGVYPFSRSKDITKQIENKTAYSEENFIKVIHEALQAPETVALLQSLIVRSNEAMNEDYSDNEDEENDSDVTHRGDAVA